jgi:hypothetical protein
VNPSSAERKALEPEFELVAFHEAGHAVIDIVLDMPVKRIQVEYCTARGGDTYVRGVVSVGGPDPRSREEWDAVALACLAGPAAEHVWLRRHGGASEGEAREIVQAANTAQANSDLRAVRSYLRRGSLDIAEARAVARRMVVAEWPSITRVARAVIRNNGQMSGRKAERIA